jgi:hypothetical protein
MSELEKVSNKLSDQELNSITSINEAATLLGVSSIDELEWNDSPWQLLDDKNALLGKKFLAVAWKFHESKEYLGNEYVSVYALTLDTINGETRFVFNDGSSGVYKQLRDLTDARITAGHKNPNAGALIKNGLKLSEYDRYDEKGVIIGKGKTFYLS